MESNTVLPQYKNNVLTTPYKYHINVSRKKNYDNMHCTILYNDDI